MKRYYYLNSDRKVIGPWSFEEMASMHATGRIKSTTQVCEEGSDVWKPYFLLDKDAISTAPSQPRSIAPVRQEGTTLKQKNTTMQHQQADYQGVTRGQGTTLILLFLIGLGAPFWILFKPTPSWEYRTLEVLAESAPAAVSPNQKAFSYKTIPNIDAQLNSLGIEGWELVSVYLEMETAHPNFGKEDLVTGLQPNVRPQSIVCIFKRLKK